MNQSQNPFMNNNQGVRNSANLFNNNNTSSQGQNPFSSNNNNNNNSYRNSNNNNSYGNNPQGGAQYLQNSNNQRNNMFNNSNSNQNSNNLFNNNNNMFNNSNNNQRNLFNNNNQGNNFSPGNNLFNNNNTSQNNNYFNSNNSQSRSNNLFNNNNSMSNNNNNMFNNNSNNLFSNNNNQGYNNYNNQGNNFMLNNTNQDTRIFENTFQYNNHIQMVRNQLQECLKRIRQKNWEHIRIDSQNIFKDQPIKGFQHQEQVVRIISQFKDIRNKIDEIKEEQMRIQKKSEASSKAQHQKLGLYKKCLVQSTTHRKMIDQIKGDLEIMNREMSEFFKPLLFAFQSKKSLPIKEPNKFDLKISYSVLAKMQALAQKVDDLMACQNQTNEQEFNSTLKVFQQLQEYYENMTCNFIDFKNSYNILKRQIIEKHRKGGYELMMGKIKKKSKENLREEYKYYDLIREIDMVLGKREEAKQRDKIENSVTWKYQ